MKPTIVEVSRRAGVSTATVSRALSAPDSVREKTRSKVLKAAAELGYRPNAMARALRRQRTSALLVLVPNIANPFYGRVIKGIEATARQAGFSVFLCDLDDGDDRIAEVLEMIKSGRADGIIHLGTQGLATVRAECAAQRGTTLINACEVERSNTVSSVELDNHGAALSMVQHLMTAGHKRLGLVAGPENNPITAARIAGAQQAAKEGGAEIVFVHHGDYTFAEGRHALKEARAVATPPSALFCFSDEVAVGAMGAAAEHGLSIPRDLAIAGFDDLPLASYVRPGLTTVSQPAENIGHVAAELALNQLADPSTMTQSVRVPYQLEIRGSTDPDR